MEWTTERRYRRYEDWTKEEKKAIQENMAKSPWHTHYHVEPTSGLLNDPNGFSYFVLPKLPIWSRSWIEIMGTNRKRRLGSFHRDRGNPSSRYRSR